MSNLGILITAIAGPVEVDVTVVSRTISLLSAPVLKSGFAFLKNIVPNVEIDGTACTAPPSAMKKIDHVIFLSTIFACASTLTEARELIRVFLSEDESNPQDGVEDIPFFVNPLPTAFAGSSSSVEESRESLSAGSREAELGPSITSAQTASQSSFSLPPLSGVVKSERDIKMFEKRKVSQAMASVSFADDQNDFRTVFAFAANELQLDHLQLEWVFMTEAPPSLERSMKQYNKLVSSLSYWLNFVTKIVPTQVLRYHLQLFYYPTNESAINLATGTCMCTQTEEKVSGRI